MESQDFKLIKETASQFGSEVHMQLFYPRVESVTVKAFVIGLVDVRAADDIRVSYDFERDGWKIEQASKFQWGPDDLDENGDVDHDWQEVAFVNAWAREVKPTE